MPLTPLLWLVDGGTLSEARMERYLGWLSLGEMQRYRAFTRSERRRQFLIGRVLLRQALGTLLGLDGCAIVLAERPGAAPWLERAGGETIGFSISHSGRWIACAASLDCQLGLDIEVIDPARDIAALAEQAFDAQDIDWLRARPETGRTRDFYDLWCAQEARIKLGDASGACIHVPHPELAIALCSAQPLQPPPRLSLRSLDA
jgi:4'-phosphopantetheinyl transferase